MSEAVKEILKLIKDKPEDWRMIGRSLHSGITNGDINVVDIGNSKPFSIVDVYVNERRIETGYIDKWKLEGACLDWAKNTSLRHYLKTN